MFNLNDTKKLQIDLNNFKFGLDLVQTDHNFKGGNLKNNKKIERTIVPTANVKYLSIPIILKLE